MIHRSRSKIMGTGRVAYQPDRSMVPTVVEDALGEGSPPAHPGPHALYARGLRPRLEPDLVPESR